MLCVGVCVCLYMQNIDEVDKKIKLWKSKNPLNDPHSQASKDVSGHQVGLHVQRLGYFRQDSCVL